MVFGMPELVGDDIRLWNDIMNVYLDDPSDPGTATVLARFVEDHGGEVDWNLLP